jgi:peptidylprolyl isomerase
MLPQSIGCPLRFAAVVGLVSSQRHGAKAIRRNAHSRSSGETMMRTFTRRDALAALALASTGAFAFDASIPATAQTAGKPMTTASGLQIVDTKVGTGASPKTGQTCVMHYTGWLYENGAKGKKFDSSLDRGQPFEFPIGMKRVIAGWDEGVASMKVGGKRTLIIPAKLGYGERGAGGVIPPNATLLFEVELLAVK